MNHKQIERFVKKVASDISVDVKYYTHKSKRASLALTYASSSEIYLNLVYLRQKKYRSNENLLIKVALLHELGHMHYRHSGLSAISEFEAHLWGVRTALKLNMFRVYRKAVYWMWTWGISKHWAYKGAYDLSLKNEECQKYYEKFGYKTP